MNIPDRISRTPEKIPDVLFPRSQPADNWDSCLDHMSGCVQLVAFHQVGPLLRGSIDGKIGVQVTIWLLGFPDQVNDLICQSMFVLFSMHIFSKHT